MANITINRYTVDATISVYRDNHHCGIIFCPTEGGRSDYLASPRADAIAQQAFTAEADAISYLVREG